MPVTRAAVLRGLGSLLTTIVEIKQKTDMFKHTLDALQFTLISLTPVIGDIEILNDDLGHAKVELEPLIKKIEDGRKLVYDCSKVHRFNCVSMCRYQAELKALEDWFLKHFSVVMIARISRSVLGLEKILKGGNYLVRGQGEVGTVSPYILTARNLYIAWGDTAWYWTWSPGSHGSFPEVAELRNVCWLEIRGWIKTGLLPSNTLYEAYFVFSKRNEGTFGFHNQAVEVFLKVVGEGDGQRQTGYLESPTPANKTYDAVAHPLLPEAEPMLLVKRREDGLLEVKLGEFFAPVGENKEVEMGVHEMKDLWCKGGIIVQGIEIRPK